MAAGNRRDVELIIRARDEASKATQNVTAALNALFNEQKQVGAGGRQTAEGLGKMVETMAAVERILEKTRGSVAKSETAFDRQKKTIAANEAELKRLRAESELASKAIVSTMLAMREGQQSQGNLVAATNAYKQIETQIARVDAALTSQRAGLESSKAALEDNKTSIVSAALALAQFGNDAERSSLRAQAAHRAEIESLKELEAQAAQTARAKDAQEKFNRFAGVDREMASARASAAVFQQAEIEATTRLAQITQAQTEAFQKNIAARDGMQSSARRLLEAANPLLTIERRLNEESAEAARLRRNNIITDEQYATVIKNLGQEADIARKRLERIGKFKGDDAKPSLFGLKPYEVQNLGYQINDVFTQIASGTPIMQVMAQQAGQIIQLIPNLADNLIGILKNPYILGSGAALGALALAIGRAADNAERLRTFDGLITRIGAGAEVTAEGLLAVSKELQGYGVSAENADAAVTKFLERGLNSDRLLEFGIAAKNTAIMMGTEVPEAAEKLADAFDGGFDSVDQLDKATQFLTNSQREHIRTLFDEGKASEARSEAFRIYSDLAEDVAQKQEGPWAKAARVLGEAWNFLLDAIADFPPIRGAISLLEELFDLADKVPAKLRLADIDKRIAVAKSNLNDLKDNGTIFGSASPSAIADAEKLVNKLVAERKQIVKEIAVAEKNQAEDTKARESERQKKIDADLKRETEREKAKLDATTDAAKVKLAYQEAYNAAIEKGASKQAAADRASVAAAKEKERLAKSHASELKKQQTATADGVITDFQMPVSGRITSTTGLRRNPVTGRTAQHAGIDIAVPIGTPVKAPADGVVIEAGTVNGYGKVVFIDHGAGTITRLAHLSAQNVKKGDAVSAGQVVGLSGNTGNSTGPHLHYEVRRNDKIVDPRTGKFPTDPADTQKILDKQIDLQDKLNAKLADENNERLLSIQSLQQQAGLRGNAVIAIQRELEIAQALRKAEDEAADKNTTLSTEQQLSIMETTGLLFDLKHAAETARNELEAVTNPVDDLTALRDQIQQQIEFYQRIGQNKLASDLEAQLVTVQDKLAAATRAAVAYYESLKGKPEEMASLDLTADKIDTIVIGLKAAARASEGLRTQFLLTGRQLNEQFADRATNGFMDFIDAVTKGENVFKSFGRSVLTFLSDFLREMAAAILKQTIFNALIGNDRTGGGGVGGSVSNLLANIVTGGGQRQSNKIGEAASTGAMDIVKGIAEGEHTNRVGFGVTDGIEKTFDVITGDVAAVGKDFTTGFRGALTSIVTALNRPATITSGGGGILGFLGNALFSAVTGSVGGAAANAIGTAASSSAMSAVTNILQAGVHHTGGIAGSPAMTRAAPAAWFENARRYHTGGIAGLRPDETAAILRKGEEVLTQGDPRHRMNGGAAPKVDLKVVNTIDPGETMAAALTTRPGQKAVLNFISENARAVQSALSNG